MSNFDDAVVGRKLWLPAANHPKSDILFLEQQLQA